MTKPLLRNLSLPTNRRPHSTTKLKPKIVHSWALCVYILVPPQRSVHRKGVYIEVASQYNYLCPIYDYLLCTYMCLLACLFKFFLYKEVVISWGPPWRRKIHGEYDNFSPHYFWDLGQERKITSALQHHFSIIIVARIRMGWLLLKHH
jgi:hypothetical protein